jgi:transmembrane sensor
MTEHPPDFNDDNSPQSADWEAVARHMSGEDTAESRSRVDSLLADPANRALLASLDEITAGMSSDVPSDIDVEAALNKVKSRFNEAAPRPLRLERSVPAAPPARRPTWRVPFPAIAAAGLIAIGLGTWFTVGKHAPTGNTATPAPRMLATGVGVRDSLRLTDGTKVILGPQSSVKVASGYDVSSREVEIRGAAYFEVVHNAARPFTVNTSNAIIKDVGTKFGVRTDSPDGVGVIVTEGSVSLAPVQGASPPVVLRAGDRGTLNSSGKVVTRRGAANDDDMAWLNGRIVFREASISEVASELRRWYGIELQLADPSLADRHLTATFSGEPADRVLEVISLALGADIERHGDTAVVRSVKGRVR